MKIEYYGPAEDGICSEPCPYGKMSPLGNPIMVGSVNCIECKNFIKGNRLVIFCVKEND